MPSKNVFPQFGKRQLRSGSKSGPVVTNPKQAVAIFESEKKKEKANGGTYPEPVPKKSKKKGTPKGAKHFIRRAKDSDSDYD